MSCEGDKLPAWVPKRRDAPGTKLPVSWSAAPVQSSGLLSAKASAAPVPRRIVALPLTSSAPRVLVKVPESSVESPIETGVSVLSTWFPPRIRVPELTLVWPV